MRRAALASAALLILALALGLRLEALGRRPMHADEAVHGLKLAEFAGRTYRYDAQNGLTSATRAVPTTGKLSTGNVPASRGRSAAPAAGRPAHCGHEPFQTG